MTSARPPLASVDEVRDELRRLGYLESGVDRFVLASTGSLSPLSASFAVALRVGVAGGVLFGFALTLVAVTLDSRLLAESRDLAVLALYLAGALGAATALAAFLGGLAAAWVGRRLDRRPGATLSRNIGLVLALTGLAYVALWWRSHGEGAPLAAQLAALAVSIGLSLALGRFGSLAAVAVLAAGGVGDRLPQASLSRRHMLPLLVSAALTLGASVFGASFLSSRVGAEAPGYAVVPTGLRVRVLGIDGLERRMTEQMIGRGEMPQLAALFKSGAHARLLAEPERVPAIAWTTIATGRGPEAHGIQSTASRRLAGMRTPVGLDAPDSRLTRAFTHTTDLLRITRPQPPTAPLRGVKPFWTVASEKGLRVGVVNWWATWPAEPVNGYVVTDRAFFRVEKGGETDREVYPAAAWDTLAALPVDEPDRARKLDLFYTAAAGVLRIPAQPDIEALYLPGLDIFTTQTTGAAAVADLAALDVRIDAVRAYYRFVDGLIGETIRSSGPGDILMVVGDPGRLSRTTAETAEGTLLLAGEAILPGDLGSASERDVAPTVLHLAGLPASRELAGRVLESALRPAFRSAHPVRFVASYGARAHGRPAESAFDPEVLRELRSLGYIQ